MLVLRALLAGLSLTAALRISPAGAFPHGTVHSRSVPPQLATLEDLPEAKTPKTVDEAKEAFFAAMAPKLASMPVQAFANNIISSTQFALVSPSYKYSRVMAVGFESLCDTFLQLVPKDEDKQLTKMALAYSLGMDATVLTTDAASLTSLAQGKTEQELFETDDFKALSEQASRLRYNYVLGAGLLALIDAVGEKPSDVVIERWCSTLGLKCSSSLQRDYAFYKSSLTKMEGMKELDLQMKATAKRQEAERLKKLAEKAAKEADDAEKQEA